MSNTLTNQSNNNSTNTNHSSAFAQAQVNSLKPNTNIPFDELLDNNIMDPNSLNLGINGINNNNLVGIGMGMGMGGMGLGLGGKTGSQTNLAGHGLNEGLDLELFDIFQMASGIDPNININNTNNNMGAGMSLSGHNGSFNNLNNLGGGPTGGSGGMTVGLAMGTGLGRSSSNSSLSQMGIGTLNNNNVSYNNNNSNLNGVSLSLAQQQIQLLQRENLLRQQIHQVQLQQNQAVALNGFGGLGQHVQAQAQLRFAQNNNLMNNSNPLDLASGVGPLNFNNENLINNLTNSNLNTLSVGPLPPIPNNNIMHGHNNNHQNLNNISRSSSSNDILNNLDEQFNNQSQSISTMTGPASVSSSVPVRSSGRSGRGIKHEVIDTTTGIPPSHSQSPSLTPSSAHFNSPYYQPPKTKAERIASAAQSHTKNNVTSVNDDDDDDDFDENVNETNSKDLKPEEKGAKRLARKAELARASRRRKKLYVQDLENKVKKLGAKIEELQSKAVQSKSKRIPTDLTREEKERKANQKQIRNSLMDLVNQQNLDNEGMNQLAELVKKFVANSRERQSNVDFHLDRVQECISPGLQVKFALWGLDQNDDFYDKPGLWTSLMVNEVGLSHSQMSAILSKRNSIHQERLNLAQCEQMLKQTRDHISNHLRSLHQHMDDIQTVMTPLQLAKFYLWVEKNEWCMQMLSTVFQVQPTNPLQTLSSSSSSSQLSLANTQLQGSGHQSNSTISNHNQLNLNSLNNNQLQYNLNSNSNSGLLNSNVSVGSGLDPLLDNSLNLNMPPLQNDDPLFSNFP